jgi:hypothetical protein
MEYPLKGEASSADAVLLQTGALGGPYAWTTTYGLVVGALDWPGSQLGVGIPLPGNALDTGVLATNLLMPSGCTFGWNYYLTGTGPAYLASGPAIQVCSVDVTGSPDHPNATGAVVFSFASGGAFPVFYDAFNFDSTGYVITANTMLVQRDPAIPLEVATKRYVDREIDRVVDNSVWSFNGRRGNVSLFLSDVTGAGGAPIISPDFGGSPTTTRPPAGSNSTAIPTTGWVNTAIGDAIDFVINNQIVSSFNGRHDDVTLLLSDILGAGGAPINNADLTGTPTSTTPPGGNNSSRIATTAFVQSSVNSALATLPSTFVTHFNGRSGNVNLTLGDVTGAGGAPLNSPHLSGTPRSTTPPVSDASTRIATTDFVQDNISNLIEREIEPLIRVSKTPPRGPRRQGDLWWDASKLPDGNGTLYIWYVDRDSGQWVDASPSIPGPPGIPGPAGDRAHFGPFAPGPPRELGELWWDTREPSLNIWAGFAWERTTTAFVGALAPIGPVRGNLWFDTRDRSLRLWDGDDWHRISGGGD